MRDIEPAWLSTSEIVNQVSTHELDAQAVVRAHLDAIDRFDSKVHAYVHVDHNARAAGGAMSGITLAVKDNLPVAGMPWTDGSAVWAERIPGHDTVPVARTRAAGAAVLGKTNLPELAAAVGTTNAVFPPTHNPWRIGITPGGSSGGSAAAVAAGVVPLALGTDTGGSIRQPGALCGIVGMKPTYGLVSRYGLIAFASSLDQIGPLAWSVADAAAVLEAIAGHDPLDSTSLAEPAPSLLDGLSEGVEGLRVGVVSDFLEQVAPYCTEAVDRAAMALEREGAVVDHIAVPELLHALPAYYLIAPAEASSNLARYDGVRYGLRVDAPDAATMNARTREAGFGPEVKRRVMLGTYALSAGYYDAYYLRAQRVRTLIARDFADAFQKVEAIITPTAPTAAFRCRPSRQCEKPNPRLRKADGRSRNQQCRRDGA